MSYGFPYNASNQTICHYLVFCLSVNTGLDVCGEVPLVFGKLKVKVQSLSVEILFVDCGILIALFWSGLVNIYGTKKPNLFLRKN